MYVTKIETHIFLVFYMSLPVLKMSFSFTWHQSFLDFQYSTFTLTELSQSDAYVCSSYLISKGANIYMLICPHLI